MTALSGEVLSASPPASETVTSEQQARDLLDWMNVAGAQTFSSGELVELANLIAERQRRAAPSQGPALDAAAGIEPYSPREVADLRAHVEHLRARLLEVEAEQDRLKVRDDAWANQDAKMQQVVGDLLARRDFLEAEIAALRSSWDRACTEIEALQRLEPVPSDSEYKDGDTDDNYNGSVMIADKRGRYLRRAAVLQALTLPSK